MNLFLLAIVVMMASALAAPSLRVPNLGAFLNRNKVPLMSIGGGSVALTDLALDGYDVISSASDQEADEFFPLTLNLGGTELVYSKSEWQPDSVFASFAKAINQEVPPAKICMLSRDNSIKEFLCTKQGLHSLMVNAFKYDKYLNILFCN